MQRKLESYASQGKNVLVFCLTGDHTSQREVERMSTIARRARTRLDELITPKQPVKGGPLRTASRAQIRSLLAPFLAREGFTVEQFDMGESGIERVRVGLADLRWWAARSMRAATDDREYRA
jgi:hypothetical protein